MKSVEVDLASMPGSPYSQSRMHDTPELPKEAKDAYEQRTWREKSNYDENGEIFIPAMALKQALDNAAKKFSITIPGKGKSTYTKHFMGGVLCELDVPLGVHKDKVPSITINANSDGVRGSGKRVKRTFPQMASWKGTARFVVMDDTITPEIFEKYLTDAGRFVGIGRFRPENGGTHGRFIPSAFRWTDLD